MVGCVHCSLRDPRFLQAGKKVGNSSYHRGATHPPQKLDSRAGSVGNLSLCVSLSLCVCLSLSLSLSIYLHSLPSTIVVKATVCELVAAEVSEKFRDF